MKRAYEIRVGKRTDYLLKLACLVVHVSDGHKPTKGAMAERLIDLGAERLFKEYDWELPEDVRPKTAG